MMSRYRCFFILILTSVVLFSACQKLPPISYQGPKVDDWKYQPEKSGKSVSSGASRRNAVPGSFAPGSYATGGGLSKSLSAPAPMLESVADSALGFSVGGAKDVNNFRENIKNNFLPLATDINHEGLFYDYFFETAKPAKCEKLFCPSYVKAMSMDPFSKNPEYFLAVGLNSGIQEADFQRKKLNLVLVLDISGSMSSAFDRYYYDQFGRRTSRDVKQGSSEAENKTKMTVAKESLIAFLPHLNSDDRLGMVLFDDQAYLAKPLNLVGETDMKALEDHIRELGPRGGTNMSSGMKMGTELFAEYKEASSAEYENRIIFLTDAMPNLGETSEEGLFGMMKRNADDKIFSTFVGIGVDLNSELIEAVTKIRGANYYAVHSEKDFKERMDEGFDYMVTPLVFNLSLKLEAPGYEILKVYGSPEANEATGEIMKVNTLFPSKTEEGETKGGLVLLHLKKKAGDGAIKLAVSYEDRLGRPDSDSQEIVFEGRDSDFFENKGIRKGILLARYVSLMKNWINYERRLPIITGGEVQIDTFPEAKISEIGIMPPPPREPLPIEKLLGKWERQSMPLAVQPYYQKLFAQFKEYFQEEMAEIGDKNLEQEVEILGKLANYGNVSDSTLSCKDWENEVKGFFESANYCDSDSDCAVISDLTCPFGCSALINKKEQSAWDRVQNDALNKYKSNNCSTCIYECMDSPEAVWVKCVKKQCVDTRPTIGGDL